MLGFTALIPVVEDHHAEPSVGYSGSIEDGITGDGHVVAQSVGFADHLIDLIEKGLCAFERRGFRQLGVDHTETFILLRNKSARQVAHTEKGDGG